jgi:AcrR family transcriptional regulator
MATEPQVTRDRILDAAERLFGQHGFPCTSLRQITDAAGVNLAAVNYHFGSKEDLYKAVLLRRLRPVNEERMKLLTHAEQLAGEQPVPIRSILETFIRPLLGHATDVSRGGISLLRLISRELTDPQPFMMAENVREFDPLVGRYTRVLTQTLPNVPVPELFWRMQFTIGGILYAAAHQYDFERISNGLCRGDDLDGCLRRLIDFCAAGLEAPLSASGEGIASRSGTEVSVLVSL